MSQSGKDAEESVAGLSDVASERVNPTVRVFCRDWRKSDERKTMIADIASGETAGKLAEEVYNMHDGIYHGFKFTNFKKSFETMTESVGRKKDCVAEDKVDIKADRITKPKKTHNSVSGILRWDGHPAQGKLKEDMAQDKFAPVMEFDREITEMELALMWTDPERHYGEFSFKRFKAFVRVYIRNKYNGKIRRMNVKSKKN